MNTAHPFTVPDSLNAAVPREYQGGRREDIRLMTLDRTGALAHHRFSELGSLLNGGDVLVLNNSRTLPASLLTTDQTEVRLARKISATEWEALIVAEKCEVGQRLNFQAGVKATIIGRGSEAPLWRIQFHCHPIDLLDFIYRFGEPIRYEYIKQSLPLQAYQTTYASVPGSLEMPSAGRAFSWKLLQQLIQKGVQIAYIQLHTGISYYGNDQWPTPAHHPEAYCVPEAAVQLIQRARQNGDRIIAVGTTVVRALESAVDNEGALVPSKGETRLYIDAHHRLRVVSGLLTGFHEPEASHLDMLSAFVSKERLLSAYQTALQKKYLWHEFGDTNLIWSGMKAETSG